MNTVTVTIGKNLILIALLIVTLLSFFNRILNWHDLLLIQAVIGLVFVFLSYYEYNTTSYKAQLPVERFAYFPGSFFMIRAIKIGVYVMVAVILATSETSVKFLSPICLIIAVTEIVITLLKYFKKLCFVNIYANYILIAKEKMVKIFATEIENIEYRHDIIYIVKKDKKTVSVHGFDISDRVIFLNKMKDWIANNNVKISAESAEKLKGVE